MKITITQNKPTKAQERKEQQGLSKVIKHRLNSGFKARKDIIYKEHANK